MQSNTLDPLSSSAQLRPAARAAIRCALVGVIAGALLAGTAAPALALSASGSVTTAVAVHQGGVTLTMDNVTRMYQAIVNLAVASKGHPEFEDALSVDGDATEAQATATIAAVPAAVDALKKAGLTPSQYVRLSLTLAATTIGAAVLKTNPSAKLPDGVTLANVHFLQQHAADIEAVQKRLAAQMAAAGVGQ
ncbi:MAG TPA: hypothetical protein VIC03_07655 [Gemmatimonadaceae bacterium]